MKSRCDDMDAGMMKVIDTHKPDTARRYPVGFTLVELLVVISVIALLIAILLPSLKHAREQAKIVRCAANLSDIGKSWQMYLNDHNGNFYQFTNANFNYGGQQGEPSVYGGEPDGDPKPVGKPLNPFFGLPEVVWSGAEQFLCPSDTGSEEIRPTIYEARGTSYPANELLIGPTQIAVPPRPPGVCKDMKKEINKRLDRLNISRIRNVSSVLFVGDFGWHEQIEDRSTVTTWHDRGHPLYNILFLDGHVRYLEIEANQWVTEKYVRIPFYDLEEMAIECQETLG